MGCKILCVDDLYVVVAYVLCIVGLIDRVSSILMFPVLNTFVFVF